MNAGKLKATAAILFFIAVISVAIPVPARADGGPVVPYELWASLEEGQQVAVVTILDQDHARVDLFISILDSTGQSHEIIFFLPLGTEVSYFNAVEKSLSYFDEQVTRDLDRTIREGVTRKQRAVQVLFSGALLTNGALLVPLWAPVLLAGCAMVEPQPDVTLQTESSRIAVYGIDENTNLAALIQTTGLAPSVIDTLSRLEGQQIAVVRLQTKPRSHEEDGSMPDGAASEPGLHLTWRTTLSPVASGAAYSYPLGTGEAWSKPIELTRVYVRAPKGLDFDIQYPKLGPDKSGYDYIEGAHIYNYLKMPSYAVDEARGDFGRVWRVTYTQSNAAEDIVVIARPQSTYSRFMAGVESSAIMASFLFALIAGLVVWVLAWYFLMPRFLGTGTGRHPNLSWHYALVYPGINVVFMIFPGAVFYFFFLLRMPLPSLLGVFLIFGGAIIGLFALIHGNKLGVSRRRAVGAFVLTSLSGSAAYLVLALVFAKIIRVI